MYQSIYNLINNLVFSGVDISGTIEGDCTTLLSLAFTCLLVSLPFYLVYKLVTGVIR